MNRMLLIALVALGLGPVPAGAREADTQWQRVWTAADGRQVTGRMLLYDGDKVVLDVNGRRFELPTDRLSERDRRWLGNQPHQDAAQGPVRKHDLVGYVQPFKLPRMPVREWPTILWPPTDGLELGPPVTGRLVDVNDNKVALDLGGGRVEWFCSSTQLCPSNYSFLSRWASFGLLERHDPPGKQGDDLRARGLTGFRHWPHPTPDDRADALSLPFQWFVPQMEPGMKYPLVVFLHGIGERGDDNFMQLSKHREPMVFIDTPSQARNPSFFMAPQHSIHYAWDSSNLVLPVALQELLVKTIWRMMTVEHVGQIDERRIYILGLSSGGLGAVQLTAFFPHIFAAGVPISCRVDARWFKDKPVRPLWFFMNAADEGTFKPTVDDLISKVPDGQPIPRLTRFPGQTHNAWSQTFRTAEMRGWLFQQVRPEENGDWLFR